MLPPDGADVVFDAAGCIDSPRELTTTRRRADRTRMARARSQVAEMRALFFHGVKIINSRVRTPETWRRAIAMVASGAVDLRRW